MSDSTDKVIRKLEHIELTLQQKYNLVDERGYLIPEAEPHIRPLLCNFLLSKKGAMTNLTLIIALCHKLNLGIPLHKLMHWTAAAWGITQPVNKEGMSNIEYGTHFGEVLDRMAKRTDTRHLQ